jgi:hypothetical protein
MLTPKAPLAPNPTAVFAPAVTMGVAINPQGQPIGKMVQLTLQGATVDASGRWTAVGPAKQSQPFTFGFDASGNVTGLPADLAPAAAAIATAYTALEAAIDAINTIRKIV